MKHGGYINMKIQMFTKPQVWIKLCGYLLEFDFVITIYEYTCMEVSNLNNNYLRDLCNISTCL